MKILLLLLTFGVHVSGQTLSTDGFVNLNFESPNLSHPQPFRDGFYVPTPEAFDGWTWQGGIGSNFPPSTYVSENDLAPLSLLSELFTHYVTRHTGVEFGQYSLSVGQLGGPAFEYHLSQVGKVPKNAVGLQYYDSEIGLPLQILLDGNPVSYSKNQDGLGVADVSQYAGKTAKLEFVFPSVGSVNYFDIAGFTTTPEPSTYALFGIGAALLWWQGRRQGNGCEL